ncbi:MAG: alpha/beta hydrolase [Clostridia bacterium]|nr:alpha/beta hydrolase [Clostridia bacterium]
MAGDFNEEYLVQAGSSYSRVMNGTVLPWLESRGSVSVVPGFENRPLYCVSYQAEHPVGTVFIVHGFTENALKYSELIFSLLHQGFSVVAYDQRGHGRSWRADGIPDISVTHVDHFSEYVEDLQIIYDTYRKSMPSPCFLFAHSMGGAVASLFLERGNHDVAGAVFSSPMIAPYIRSVPVPVASALSSIASFMGRGKRWPFFMKPYSGPEDFSTSCATDPDRFAWYDAIKASRAEFRNSVPSYRWSYEAVHVTDQILASGAPESITCPVILFSAETDFSVEREPQQVFISRVRNGQFIPVSGARHEIFRSVNDVLFPWWRQVISFLKANCQHS